MKPLAREGDLVIRQLDGETLVYDLRTTEVSCLNPTSALVWSACDGARTASDIAAHVSQVNGSEVTEEVVLFALAQLHEKSLLVDGHLLDLKFAGMSRRAVLRRLGFVSLAAVPVIVTVAAPAAAAASSVCGQACQCSGLLSPVSVCPPGFADCSPGCTCTIPPGGCFNSGDGVIACNGVCTPLSTCPPSSPGDCTCFGNFSINQTCSGVQCPGGCSACKVTSPCVPQEVGPPACNGVCQ